MNEPTFTNGTSMILRSGKYLDLMDPCPGDFTFADIAGGLAKICRYGNQTPGNIHLSVAEHCWTCDQIGRIELYGAEVRKCLLMHDATEAFLGDVIRPLKFILGVGYKFLEEKLFAVIERKFGLCSYQAIVKKIDNEVLIAERKLLYPTDTTVWQGQDSVRDISSLIKIFGWERDEAERNFTESAKALGINTNI